MTALHTLGILSTSFMECFSINRCALLKVILWNFFVMPLTQSVFLWQGRGGIQKTAQFGKNPRPYYGKNSSNKQRETTGHRYFKTWRSVNPENVMYFFFKFSRKLPLLQRIRVNCISDRSPNKCFTEFKWQTHLNINCSEETAWIRPSWSNCCKKTLLKDMNEKRRLAWAKNHKQCIVDRWE
jgi:hypothetical protein